MNVLWLASWYPDKINPFEGDFVQRHACAAALYNNIFVIKVVPDEKGIVTQDSKTEINKQGSLTEQIIYLKKSSSFLGRINSFLKELKVLKVAVTKYMDEHGKPGIVHVHVPMKAGMIARWIRKTSAIPYVITEHSAHYGMGSDDDFFSKSPFYKRNVSRIFKEAAVVTNVSAALAEVIRKLFGLKRVCVIHNTVDTELFNYKLREKTRFRFIHVSTLTEAQKNIKGILRAVENLAASRDDFEVIIVGPASGELRELVAGPPLKRFVTLTGEISYAEVAGQMQRASALVLFSRYENFPCVVIEALCCGLPVIASNVGGVKEAVAENNGILVQSGNENGLVQAMNRMINDYQNFDRSQIAKDACEKFSYSTIGKQLDELYRKALKLNSAN